MKQYKSHKVKEKMSKLALSFAMRGPMKINKRAYRKLEKIIVEIALGAATHTD